MYDLIIIGSGPAGLSAAVYGKRAGFNLVVLEKNPMSGGQVLNTYEVDNYLGMPGSDGFDMGMKFREHADKMGVEFREASALSIEDKGDFKIVRTEEGDLETGAVILATGAVHATLGVEGEEKFSGKGVSYCATCDGAFFRGKTVAVVGGGDVALEDAIYLARLAEKVYLIHRRDELRGAYVLQEQLKALPNVEFLYSHVTEEILGGDRVEGLRVRNLKTGESSTLAAEGVFVAVGIRPGTELVRDLADCDEGGYVLAGEDCVTTMPGLFAAGDVRKKPLRQISTAVADGANAAVSAENYLRKERNKKPVTKYYLGIDIGASSGRHILAHLEDGKMVLEEVHRFPNGAAEKDGELAWDVDELFAQIKLGMKKCAQMGKIPVSVGVDTWGVDIVLLDGEGKRLGNAVAYRDSRTKGMDEEVYKRIAEEELYARTGIQKAIYNTVYQLMALKTKKPEILEKAETMLMMPDYFHYLLSGVAMTEYTEATTGQLVSPVTKDWDMELIEKLGYPKRIFRKIVMPGTEIGHLTESVREEVGFDCKVVVPATHDTGSAVIAVPTDSDNALYISSGTWSLMGTERKEAECSPESRARNLTNEGGWDYRFRYLKNIMGLWMIQSVKKEMGGELGFGEICEMASKCSIPSIVDCNDDRFLAPANMTQEVRKACEESGQQVPEGLAEVACVIYNSLARCYAKTIVELEGMTGAKYDRIHIVGGGSNAEYLNQLTAKATGIPVYAGPTEATAIGNIAAQMMAAGELQGLKDARACVFRSFPIRIYE